MDIDKNRVSMEIKRKSVQDRFMDKVMPEPNTGCWIWTASLNYKGYGQFGIGGKYKSVTSHRVSYEMFKGIIHKDMHVLHHCDNPWCVNPDHLWLGTNNDNIQDKIEKQRTSKGENHARAKITTTDVLIIREARTHGFTYSAIAGYYNLGLTTVRSIVSKINWKHV